MFTNAFEGWKEKWYVYREKQIWDSAMSESEGIRRTM
jgi:hypothetical protein